MQPELKTITCTHSVSAIRCGLFFSDDDKPKSQTALREYLRTEFPIDRRRPDVAHRSQLEGFRPRRAYFDVSESTFVWQEGGSVYLQSESMHRREEFMRTLNSVIAACGATRARNVEPLQLEVALTNRFEFSPYEMDWFELHKYFSIIPQPADQIRKERLFAIQAEMNLCYAEYSGSMVEMSLKFPAYRRAGCLDAMVDLAVTSRNPFVGTIEEAMEAARKELNAIEQLTFEAATPQLHQILNWT